MNKDKTRNFKGANNSYFGDIREGIGTLTTGLRLSLRHIFQARKSRKPYSIWDNRYFEQKDGLVTLQYPNETLPVPDNGRYRLYNEIDDCIVCDKCAKVCPVNCIEIEPIKSPEEIGKTSDGTSKRLYAATFDIDMAKCCYCGLCTTVCPTECLTMTKVYDFSETEVENFTYKFSDLSPEQAVEKKRELEEFNLAKELLKLQNTPAVKVSAVSDTAETTSLSEIKTEAPKPIVAGGAKPVFKPKMKPATPATEGKDILENKAEATLPTTSAAPKPVFKPKVKPLIPAVEKKEEVQAKTETPAAETPEAEAKPEVKPAAKPVFKPKIKPLIPPGENKKEE